MQHPIIEIRNLSKRFGNTFALKEINLAVYPKEIFGIIGMSGAGKSTLIRCLATLEKPSKGAIFLKGDELTGLDKKQLRTKRKQIGMIFQHFNLFFSRTALENIMYPLEISGVPKEERLKRAHELIELVGLTGKENLYPTQLSGGQKQRVAIARALANYPEVLLCDEATSALDPHTTHSILELLSALNQKLGLTIVLITHEMQVIKEICTKVAVLEHGEVVEEGETGTLFAQPQHPTTKRFLQNMSHEIPDHILPEGDNQELLRLSFTGTSAKEPVISRLIREYQVEVNILFGSIDILKKETVGCLVIALSGSSDERQKARQFLADQDVFWEEVG